MPQDDKALGELRAACDADDTTLMRKLFAAGRLDAHDATGELQRHKGNFTVLRCLLEHGADPSVFKIILVDSGELLRLLTEFGYDIKSCGHLVLHKFAGDRVTLDWLLDQGVDINRTNTRQLDNGVSLAQGESENSIKVLNNVAAAGDLQLFDHLVARGADVSRSLSLHCASKCQDASSSMIAHLLDRYNMDIHADTDALRDFFRDAKDSGTPLCSAIYHENIVAVEELLKRGADPERCGTSGHRPIVKAIGDSANVGFLPALKPLLKAGVDTASALRCAVDHGRVEAAKICLQAGADPVSALSLAFRVEQSNAHEAAIDGSERNEEARQNSVAITKLSQTWIKE